MVKYNPLSPSLVQELESIVGAKNVTVDPEKMEDRPHPPHLSAGGHDEPRGSGEKGKDDPVSRPIRKRREQTAGPDDRGFRRAPRKFPP